MSVEQQWIFAGYGHVFLALGLAPLLLFLLVRKKLPSERKWNRKILICTLLAWFLQMQYRTTVELPISMHRAELHGDTMYDGVGGNVAILLMGWFWPLILCFFVRLLFKIYDRFQTKKIA
jgi:hypothetical protein